MPSELIRQAMSLLKAGQKDQARRLMVGALKRDPQDWEAWVMMAQLVEKQEEAIYCLERAQRLNPGEARISQALARLRGAAVPPPPPRETPPPLQRPEHMPRAAPPPVARPKPPAEPLPTAGPERTPFPRREPEDLLSMPPVEPLPIAGPEQTPFPRREPEDLLSMPPAEPLPIARPPMPPSTRSSLPTLTTRPSPRGAPPPTLDPLAGLEIPRDEFAGSELPKAKGRKVKEERRRGGCSFVLALLLGVLALVVVTLGFFAWRNGLLSALPIPGLAQPAPTATPTVPPPTPTLAVIPTREVTNTPTATQTPRPTLTPTPGVGSSRDNPAPPEVEVQVGDLILVLSADILRPVDLVELVGSRNVPEAGRGNEFLRLIIEASCSVPSSQTCYLSLDDFIILTAADEEVMPTFVGGVPEALGTTEFPGGTPVSGMMFFEVGIGEGGLLLVYTAPDGQGQAYFLIPEPQATPTPTATPTRRPSGTVP